MSILMHMDCMRRTMRLPRTPRAYIDSTRGECVCVITSYSAVLSVCSCPGVLAPVVRPFRPCQPSCLQDRRVGRSFLSNLSCSVLTVALRRQSRTSCRGPRVAASACRSGPLRVLTVGPQLRPPLRRQSPRRRLRRRRVRLSVL